MTEWFSKIGENLKGGFAAASENIGSFLAFIGIIVGIIIVAVISERLIDKKREEKKPAESRTHRMVIIAMLSAIAIVLNLFGFPLWFVPGVYKLDIAELPAIIGGFAMGPVAGVEIEVVKILLNLLFNQTATAYIGEIANFIMSCAFVLPASIVYYKTKSKKNAVIGLIVGTVIMVAAGALLNAYLLLPVYARVFFKKDTIEDIIAMGTAKNGSVVDLKTFILFAVVPFNFIKCLLVDIFTAVIYLPRRKHMV